MNSESPVVQGQLQPVTVQGGFLPFADHRCLCSESQDSTESAFSMGFELLLRMLGFCNSAMQTIDRTLPYLVDMIPPQSKGFTFFESSDLHAFVLNSFMDSGWLRGERSQL